MYGSHDVTTQVTMPAQQLQHTADGFSKSLPFSPWVLLPPYAPGQAPLPTDLQEQIESGCSNKNRRAGPKGDLTYHGKCVHLLAGTLHYTYLARTPILNSAVRLHS